MQAEIDKKYAFTGKKLTPVVIDFETYYGKSRHKDTHPATCSLSGKLSYSEYIAHPSFDVTLLAVHDGSEPVVICPPQIDEYLQSINWDDTLLICHNSLFDSMVLLQHYGIQAAAHFDTLGAARALYPHIPRDLGTLAQILGLSSKKAELSVNLKQARDKYYTEWSDELKNGMISYAAHDAELTWKLFETMLPGLDGFEIELMNWTLTTWTNPTLKLDYPRIQKALTAEEERIEAVIAKTGISKSVFSSNPKFSQLLTEKGVNVPMKTSPTTGELIPAIGVADIEFKKLWVKYPQHIELLEARVAAKNTNERTRMERLISIADCYQGKLPVAYQYYGAHTGRISGSNKSNFQNFRRGSETRMSITAPEGHVLVVCDSAQIEARTLATLASHDTLMQRFRDGEDVYAIEASATYGRPISKKTDPDERNCGKVQVLGLGYGMGWRKFQNIMALGAMGSKPVAFSDQQAKNIVFGWRGRNPPISDFWGYLDGCIDDMYRGKEREYKGIKFKQGYVELPYGNTLQYPGLSYDPDSYEYSFGPPNKRTKLYGGILAENITQAIARTIIMEQLLMINRQYPVVMTTHDEVTILVPEHQAEEAFQFMLEIMRTPPTWLPDVPLDAEGGYAKEYSK